MSAITTALTQLGLTEKEALTYTALLEMGDSSAYAISKKSGIKKPTTYVILDELRKKELVVKKPQAKRTLYAAKDPGELLRIAEDNLTKTQAIVPKLKSLSRKETLETQTLFFEGKREVGDAVLYKKEEWKGNDIVGFYAYIDSDMQFQEIRDQMHRFSDEVMKKDIYIRGIVPKHDSLHMYREEDAQFHRSMKEVPFDDYSSEVSIEAHGSFVRILDMVEHQAVIIDNPRVAKAVKQIFEMIWKEK